MNLLSATLETIVAYKLDLANKLLDDMLRQLIIARYEGLHLASRLTRTLALS